jgi:hypothetical protein
MRISVSKLLVSASIVVGMAGLTNAASAQDVIGWIEINPVDRQISITARAYAPVKTQFEYELRIERVGRSGKTATKQRGKADLEPSEAAQLSMTSVNIEFSDQLAILLEISSGGRIISSSALHVGPQ